MWWAPTIVREPFPKEFFSFIWIILSILTFILIVTIGVLVLVWLERKISVGIQIWSIYTCYTSNWTNGRFLIIYKICCYFDCAYVDTCVVVWWCVVVYSCDYNFDVTCDWCCDYKNNVIWIYSCCCSFDATCSYWCDCISNVIWICFCCCSFDVI
jgi:hypothetical protein